MSWRQDQQYPSPPHETRSVQPNLPFPGPPPDQFSSRGSSRTISPQPIATGVVRGNIGSAYGPYSYERAGIQRSSGISTASTFTSPFQRPRSPEKKPISPVPVRRGVTDSTASNDVPIYQWHTEEPEEDDALHAPDPKRRRGRSGLGQPFVFCSARGWSNGLTLGLLIGAIFALFIGYPVILHVRDHTFHGPGFNLGGINGSGQIPDLPGLKTLLDKDTPSEAHSRVGTDGNTYNLVFSDEFTTDGRTFYPGDDPYWEAPDMHYWATGDLEWYSPDAITTANGSLVITMTKTPNHGLDYMSGMLTSWNKFCFTTGYIEVSVSLPGSGTVAGFWPGVWTMGNLGRAGYGATTDGTWPYSYAACDVGTYPKQMDKSGNPVSSATDGWLGAELSDQPGQRLSACTCPGSDHLGPDVTTGRGAPELDIIEAQVDTSIPIGEVSQSLQVAPFNAHVQFDNSTPATTLYDTTITHLNSFTGTTLQQGVSAVTHVDTSNYNNTGYAVYGLEYWSDMNNRDDGYITWYSQGQKSWTATSASIGPDSVSQVSQRLIPEEPMYIILNFGMAPSFEAQDFAHLIFPSKMYIDYVRVYQRSDVDINEGVTCDPSHHPTSDYIQNHADAYTNPNWTTWNSAGYTFPRNSQYDGC